MAYIVPRQWQKQYNVDGKTTSLNNSMINTGRRQLQYEM